MPTIHRISYEEIAHLKGIQICRRSLTAAFEKERYHRRTAEEKPRLTPKHIEARLKWARAHEN